MAADGAGGGTGGGETPPTLHVPRPDESTPADVVSFYREETAAVDAVLDAAESFDLPSRGEMRPTTLRWVVVHLLEETARHAGHMDITRELLDGRTGR